jgi:hypothetical protein
MLCLCDTCREISRFVQGPQQIYPQKEKYPNSTLWLFNIAMGNGPFIDGLPIENGDFPWLCEITRG